MDTLLRETVNAVVNSRFPEMSIEGRRQIENILIREEYPKGAIALNEGEVAHEIVFVGKGMLRQYYYKNGKDVTEHFSYEGCIVMCIESFLKQVPTKLIVETLEPVVLYMFPRDMLFKLAKENWEINMFYQKILEYSLIVSQIKADSWRQRQMCIRDRTHGASNRHVNVITSCSKRIRKSSNELHWHISPLTC